MVKNLYTDTETTGLYTWKNELYQIGAVMEIDGEVVGEFSGFCRPVSMSNVDPGALKVSNRTMADLQSYGSHQEMFKNFLKFLSKFHDFKSKETITLIGQNIIKFDVPFLKKFFDLNGYGDKSRLFDKLFGYQFIDLYPFNFFLRQVGYIPKSSRLKLDVMRDFYGVKIAHAHDALEDAKSTREIMKIIEKLFFKKPNELILDELDKNSPLYIHLEKLQSEFKK